MPQRGDRELSAGREHRRHSEVGEVSPGPGEDCGGLHARVLFPAQVTQAKEWRVLFPHNGSEGDLSP